MAGGCTTGQRVVSASHARAHELRGEPAYLWSARSGFDGDRLAKPVNRCTLCHSPTCSNWTDPRPHWSTTYECLGSAALRSVLRPDRLHDLDRDDHCPVDDKVTEPSGQTPRKRAR